ncbi:MAG: class I SAM-dependent rRNA methyltransferase [Oligoflexia bacterium]|nr:class I SAM-dependent rRNA methyltransferase [Oligoflexia bacterium]
MRSINLNNKAKLFQNSYYEKEILDKVNSFRPGEWVIIQKEKSKAIGFINPLVQHGPCLRVIEWKSEVNVENEKELLFEKLNQAIQKRQRIRSLQEGSRLCYGDSDQLPGLIIDEYVNLVIVQINTAGIDTYREDIKSYISDKLGKEVALLDNEKYRSSESLPMYETQELPSSIQIKENGLSFEIDSQVLQKIGYYYDHRMNRDKLYRSLSDNIGKIERGVDLFSYIGSWGLNALKAGVDNLTFVDQGNFEKEIAKNLELNNFEGRGEFVRADVFDWLKSEAPESFDLVISDPPAFKKSSKNKNNALIGYEKLHRFCLDIVKPQGFLVSASCTQDISLEELDKSVHMANKKRRGLSLVDCGFQGPDHPMSGFKDKSFYIKYLLYRVD